MSSLFITEKLEIDLSLLYLPYHATSTNEQYTAMRKIQCDIQTIHKNCPDAFIYRAQAAAIRKIALTLNSELMAYIELCDFTPPFFCTPLFQSLKTILEACRKLNRPRKPLIDIQL
jgi:hypothetical protein